MQNKCLGVFLVLITLSMVMLSILVFSTQKLTSPKYYPALFSKSNTYELAIKALPKADDQSKNSENIFTQLSGNITPLWVEQTLSSNLDKFDAYLNNRSQTFDPVLDITTFKDDLTDNLPSEVAQMVPNIISFATYTDYLNNANQLVTSAVQSAPGVNQSDLKNIDQQMDQTKKLQQQFEQNANSIKTSYRLNKIISYIIYALTLLLLVFIALAARHYVPAIFRWTGQALFLGGLFSLIGAILAQYIIKNYNFITTLKISREINQLITPLYQNITTDITTTMIKIAFLISVIGLISIIVSYLLSHFRPQTAKT